MATFTLRVNGETAVRCVHAEGAGCYGHNGADDVALDAALVARATGGKPVKLHVNLLAARHLAQPFAPHLGAAHARRVRETCSRWSRSSTRSRRRRARIPWNFACATRRMRVRAVIEATARRARWDPVAKGDGRYGRGLAFSRYKNLGCYCATVAEVEVDRASRRVRVSRVVAAVDAGEIVNPDGVVNQIEGGIIQSASWTLKESVRFDRTRVTTRSWADYPILRFDEVPEVDVNAIAHATGRRLRALPFTPDVVKAALA